MASKYDEFWVAKTEQLQSLIKEAAETGASRWVDVSAIKPLGSRRSWTGSVDVDAKGSEGARGAAHMRSLGRFLLPLAAAHPGVRFRLRMNKACYLRAEAQHAPRPSSVQKTVMTTGVGSLSEVELPGVSLRTADALHPDRLSTAIHQVVWKLPRQHWSPESLQALPPDGIYFFFEEGEETPEGPRIVRVGINESDGRFPDRLRSHLHGNRNSSVFRRHLGTALLRKEGHSEALVNLWLQDDIETAGDRAFVDEIEAAVSRMLEERFSFSWIPVPEAVDRKLLEAWLISALAVGPLVEPSPEWLGRWSPSSKIVQSGLWNVEHAGSTSLLGRSDLMGRFLSIVSKSELPINLTGYSRERKPTTLVIIPCSGTKTQPAQPVFPDDRGRSFLEAVSATKEQLRRGREGLTQRINWTSPRFAALDYYDGGLYRASGFRWCIARALQSNQAEVLILSGAYGAVFADEHILDYNQMLDAAYWVRHGLPRALEEYIRLAYFRRVYAFTASTTSYARIVRGVSWQRLHHMHPLEEAGLFSVDFRGHRGAQRIVPAVLGEAVIGFLGAALDKAQILGKPLRGERLLFERFLPR